VIDDKECPRHLECDEIDEVEMSVDVTVHDLLQSAEHDARTDSSFIPEVRHYLNRLTEAHYEVEYISPIVALDRGYITDRELIAWMRRNQS